MALEEARAPAAAVIDCDGLQRAIDTAAAVGVAGRHVKAATAQLQRVQQARIDAVAVLQAMEVVMRDLLLLQPSDAEIDASIDAASEAGVEAIDMQAVITQRLLLRQRRAEAAAALQAASLGEVLEFDTTVLQAAVTEAMLVGVEQAACSAAEQLLQDAQRYQAELFWRGCRHGHCPG